MIERLRRILELFEGETTESLEESVTVESPKESHDEEAKEPATCFVCLINTPKVVFTSCWHCACIRSAKKLNKCHNCRKKIYQRKEIFLD